MSSKLRIVVLSGASAATVKGRLRATGYSGFVPSVIERVGSFVSAIAGGVQAGRLTIAQTAVSATGTVTFSSIAAADTVTIGATLFTGSNSATGTAQFLTNGTPSAAADKVAAASLASVINANTTTNKLVVASNVSGTAVVTITAQVPGLIGNFFPIAISAHGTVSGSGLLTSGSEDTNVVVYNGI